MSNKPTSSATGSSFESPTSAKKVSTKEVIPDNMASVTAESGTVTGSKSPVTKSSTASTTSVSDEYMLQPTSDVEDDEEENVSSKSKSRAGALKLELSIRNIYTTGSSYGRSSIGTPTGAPSGCILM